MLARSRFQTRKPPRAGRPAWKCAEEFKRWLRKLPSALSGQVSTSLRDPIVVAHVDHAGQGTRDAKGLSSKVSDRFCIPLLDSEHQRQHSIGWPAFERELPGGDAVALANEYWDRWPGRAQWERDLAETGEVRR